MTGKFSIETKDVHSIVDCTKNSLNSLIDSLEDEKVERLRTKKLYIGLRINKEYLYECYKRKDNNSIMYCMSDSRIIAEYDIGGIFVIYETYEAIYITASNRNQAKMIAGVGCSSEVPKENEELRGCVVTSDIEAPVFTEVSFGQIQRVKQITDCIYVIYNGNMFFAVEAGYNIEQNPVNVVELEPQEETDLSYY